MRLNKRVEKKINKTTEKLFKLRKDLKVLQVQQIYLDECSEEERVRALVSERNEDIREAQGAVKAAIQSKKAIMRISKEIRKNETKQNELLDRLFD